MRVRSPSEGQGIERSRKKSDWGLHRLRLPSFFDKPRTIEKTIRWIEEAGRLGLDLVVFPEVFIAAYPYWRGAVSVRRSTLLQLQIREDDL